MSSGIAQRPLGKNGPSVSRIGYGSMGLSAFYGKKKPDEQRFQVLDAVVDNGCIFIDSADIYGDSEDLIGEWFKKNPGLREKVILATKFSIQRDADGTTHVLNDKAYIKKAIEKSTKRLGTNPDLYYVHRIDPKMSIELTMRALKELVDEGKIKYIGLSEPSAKTLERACKVHHVTAVQMEYSPWTLDIEQNNLLKVARENGVAIVAYSPVGRGMLTGKFKSPDDFEEGDFRKANPRFSKENFPKNLDIVDKITQIAEKKGCTASQLTLAWILAQGDDFFPIPGTTKIENLKENLEAASIELTKDEIAEIRDLCEKAEFHGDRYVSQMMNSVGVDTPELNE